MTPLAALKGIPILVLALYAVSRGLPTGRAKHADKADPAAQIPSALTGVVQKVMQDDQLAYVLIEGQGGRHWVGIHSDPPAVGQQVSCEVSHCVDAYESQKLTMAFERMFFAEELSVT